MNYVEKSPVLNPPPPQENFASAIAQWTGLLGAEHVHCDRDSLARYGASTLPRGTAPTAVLHPASTADVQQLVRIAARFGIPLYPISRGRNWGYGDACAVTDGQVIVDLGRMNRILEVDERLAYAVIEPGVTQGQLSHHLRDNHIPLWLDCTGAGPDASILGNILERGFGHTPYGNRFQTICGMEIVLANGKILNTGTGHYAASRTKHVFPTGLGPSLDGLFTQSNMGIVTRMGIWLMPKPECFNAFFCFIEKHEDIAPVIEALRPLRLDGTLRSVVHIGNDLRLISSGRTFPRDRADGASRLSPELRAALRKEGGLGAWAAAGGLYGTRRQVAAARRAVRRALRGPGRRLVFFGDRSLALGHAVARCLGPTPWGHRLRAKLGAVRHVFDLNQGIPTGQFLAGAFWRRRHGLPPAFPEGANPAADDCGLLWLSPAIPMTGEAVLHLHQIVEPIYGEYGFDLLITVSMINERTLGAVMTVAYDRQDAAECSRADACYRALFAAVMEAGYVPYRVGIQSMADLGRGSEGFWDTVRAIKQALDPAGIIAPGRYDPKGAGESR